MKKNAKANQFKNHVEEMAKCLLSTVEETLSDKSWQCAYVDVRASAEGGGGRAHKLRIVLPDNTVVKNISVPMEITLEYLDAWELMSDVFDKTWYGLKITVFPDGRHEIAYNYDPNCVNEESFYDW